MMEFSAKSYFISDIAMATNIVLCSNLLPILILFIWQKMLNYPFYTRTILMDCISSFTIVVVFFSRFEYLYCSRPFLVSA